MDKTCWVITDGRTGIENQAKGLAEAVGLATQVKRVHPRKPWSWLPSLIWPPITRRWNPLSLMSAPEEGIAPPWPDLLIATGRQSIPYSLIIRRLSEGKTLTVQTQHPRIPSHCFDLVVPPYHDLLAGPNVEPIIGAPHCVTPEKLSAAAKEFAPFLAHLPRPLVAVLIGGESKAYRFSPERMETLCEDLAALTRIQGAGLAITTSRRTGEKLEKILAQGLDGLPIFLWDGRGPNPYLGMLGLADHILVTVDSVNMATEAAATGKPIYTLPLPGGSTKFRRFHRDMEEYGATRPFNGRLDTWSYRPLNEMTRIASLIRKRLGMS